MSAPRSAPFYFDLLGGREAGLDPNESARFLVDNLVSTVETFPDWVLDEPRVPVTLTVAAHQRGTRAVIAFLADGAEGSLEIVPDVSGWVLLVAVANGREVFRGYMNQPYEEYEIWPDGAVPPPGEEAPGRMSKHQWWISLSSAVWPGLAPLANEHGWVNLSHDEQRLQGNDAETAGERS